MFLLIYHRFSNSYKTNILKSFWWLILYGNETVCSKHYSSKNWVLSSYVENAIRSAINWKDINNEVMQWKAVVIVYRADKADLVSKHF